MSTLTNQRRIYRQQMRKFALAWKAQAIKARLTKLRTGHWPMTFVLGAGLALQRAIDRRDKSNAI